MSTNVYATAGNIQLASTTNKIARNDADLIKALSEYTGKHPGTITRWFYTDDVNLIRIDILARIAAHYGQEWQEIVTIPESTQA